MPQSGTVICRGPNPNQLLQPIESSPNGQRAQIHSRSLGHRQQLRLRYLNLRQRQPISSSILHKSHIAQTHVQLRKKHSPMGFAWRQRRPYSGDTAFTNILADWFAYRVTMTINQLVGPFGG